MENNNMEMEVMETEMNLEESNESGSGLGKFVVGGLVALAAGAGAWAYKKIKAKKMAEAEVDFDETDDFMDDEVADVEDVVETDDESK